MGIFKQSISVEGQKVNIDKISPNGDVSIYDARKYVEVLRRSQAIVDDVTIVYIDTKERYVILRWQEYIDRPWWEFIKRISGFIDDDTDE